MTSCLGRLEVANMSKHERVLKATGKRVSEIAAACGMTEWGIRKCLRANRPPKNPHSREAYKSALGVA